MKRYRNTVSQDPKVPVLLMLLASLLFGCAGVSAGAPGAGPSVGELRRVCDRAFEQGFTGLDAATCEWFVAPCACRLRASDAGAPPWCVPQTESIDATVLKVLAALRAETDRDAPAGRAVQGILERIYPCPGSERD